MDNNVNSVPDSGTVVSSNPVDAELDKAQLKIDGLTKKLFEAAKLLQWMMKNCDLRDDADIHVSFVDGKCQCEICKMRPILESAGLLPVDTSGNAALTSLFPLPKDDQPK
jgi:hypothetical protein